MLLLVAVCGYLYKVCNWDLTVGMLQLGINVVPDENYTILIKLDFTYATPKTF